MDIQIDKYDILWTYLSKFLRIGQGVVLLPLILRYLPTDQIAIWAIFTTITALVSVFDLGFSNVFSRNVTQILSGLSSNKFMKGEGIKPSFSYYDLNKLLVIMKKFYMYVSCFLFFILSTLGTFYIYTIGVDVNNKYQLYFSWTFLIGSAILNFFYNYLTIILESKGLIKETQKINVYGIFLSMMFGVIGILLGWGLIAVTLSGFISVIFNRFFLYKMYNVEIKPIIANIDFDFDIVYFKEIWAVTYKVSIASISSIAIYRSGIIIISLFLPLHEAGIFAFSMNIAFILSEVSFMFFYTHLPQINSMVYKKNFESLKKTYLASILMSIISLSGGGAILVFFGNDILHFIGSNMSFIQGIPFAFVILILLLDQIQNMSTFILFSDNKLDYMWPYAISSVLIMLSTFSLCMYSPSYYAVILPQLFIQLCFNYWFWPKQVFQKLDVKMSDFKRSLPFLES